MNLEFLAHTFYGNTIIDWLISFVFIMLFILAGKLSRVVVKKIIKRLPFVEKFKLDDLFLKIAEKPLGYAIILVGTRFSLSYLNLPNSFENFVAKSFQFCITIIIAWVLSRVIDIVFSVYLIPLAEATDNELDDLVLPILRRGSKFIIWALGIIVGLNNAGYDVGAVLAGLGIGGFAFAIAAKDTVSNIFGGLTIFIDQPFKINDRVKVKGIDGFVIDIGLRSTRLITLEGRMITLPNSAFSDNAVENVSSEPSRRTITSLRLDLNNTFEQVENAIMIIRDCIQKHPHIDKQNILVGLKEIKDRGFEIQERYYITNKDLIMETECEINLEILKALQTNQIQLARNILDEKTT